MRITSKNALRFLALSAIPVLTGTAMKTVACFSDLNYATGYFTSGLLSALSAYIIAAVCIAAISYLFISKECALPLAKPTGALTFIPAGIAGAAQLFLAVEMLFGFFGSTDGEDISLGAVYGFALAILGVFSAVAFFFTVFYEKRENTRRAAYLLTSVIFFAGYAAMLYFDTSTPLNSPAKIADQMAYIASAVFFLYEVRISLGRSIWRAHTAFGIAAAATALYASVPTLILYLAKGILVSGSLASSLYIFALGIFAIARAILFTAFEREEESETVRTVRSLANARMEELSTGATHERRRGVAEDESIGENYAMNIPEKSQNPQDSKEESAY